MEQPENWSYGAWLDDIVDSPVVPLAVRIERLLFYAFSYREWAASAYGGLTIQRPLHRIFGLGA